MCGIFAAFKYRGTNFSESDFIEATKLVAHRGPDNIGWHGEDNCFLGHTRLAIVGVEASSNQPFHHEDLVMTYNGEIFNYIELRAELTELGYKFDTHSDTEVVIKAFHAWGPRCFARFNGMWALAIYDKRKKLLTVSRDRFGQKPLFVLRSGDALYFASEFQQLAPFSDRQIDFGLIQMFLKEGTYEGHGRTFYKSIQEFPKAHYCEFDTSPTQKSVRYWDYWTGEIRDADEACHQQFTELLKDAVKIRLRADVPVGLLVSGGVDSTLIAAFSREILNSGTRIPAFTYASKDEHDESIFAERVAKKLQLSLTLREQEQNPNDYKTRLRQLVKHMGRGHSSPAIVSVDYLYESVAMSGVRVALDGQGADELLAGYKTYFPILICSFLLKGNLKQALYTAIDLMRSGFISMTTLFLRNVMPPFAKRIGRWFYGYERFFESYAESDAPKIVEESTRVAKNKNALNRYLIWHHDLGLANLLYYGDIVAMKNSVENRSPYMDHRLVELVFSASEKLKVWDGIDKYALRTLPEYETFRSELDRKKVGFASDIKLETKRSMIEELRNSPILKWPIFKGRLVSFLNEAGIATPKYERFLFRLYQVHLWNDIFQVSDAERLAPTPPQVKREDWIYIDWISAEGHISFNKSLFAALEIARSELYVFAENMRMDGQRCTVVNCHGRFRQTLEVIKICRRHKGKSIFFLTYDPVLIPLLQFFCRRIYVYEHNTTPESARPSKHSIWQRLFYRKILRLAQYPNQVEVLNKLGQRSSYLGSPLRRSDVPMKHEAPSVFLAPSWRLQVAELLKVKKIVGDKEIVVKRGSLSESELTLLSRELNITPLDWIDLDYYLPKSIAIIVTIFSKTRGSGWFNEAIKFGIPLIVTSPDVEEIMKRTFPQYPFIHLDEVHTPNELDEALQEIRSYTHDQYIDQYNQEMKKRFVEILHNDGL